MPFNFKKLEIPEIVLIEPKIFPDGRGFFIETYKYSDFADFGIKENFIQDNYSKSTQKGVLRGLHYQIPPFSQGKIIQVISGEIFDVAVDIRDGSPSYGKWVGVNLSSENRNMLYIPFGFAHGFCTLSEVTEVMYKCTNIYSPQHERGIIWNDSILNIDWQVDNPILSLKDTDYLSFDKIEKSFIYNEI
ncbi:MAG: dTDP-4-dehydrorhamnose 3,5-epimerase [Candidatus Omnitrophica bacterium]|nr:dTDP-4-dehydrorhamnose 3,5-epimerase [Candidatus Omnitrophota bacterium]